MNEFKSGLNILSDQNLPILLAIMLVWGIFVIIVILLDRYYIPTLNQENKFVMWWKRNVINEDPYL